jgi:hypothetical protein
VNRLRNLDFRCTVMPFVLAALALRALIPAGFMPGSSETFGFTAMLCAPPVGAETRVVRERFELPASPGAHPQTHCEFCGASPMGALPAIEGACPPSLTTSRATVSFLAQVSTSAPDRAPSARAPPA